MQAQATLQDASQARQRITLDRLSPTTRSWLARADGYSASLDQALSVALALPRLLGGSNEGPKTYLILVQNEDELRATGGFITAVGKVVVWNGKLISWDIADSYSVDDPSKAYPPAPWQMQSFMNIPILTFRDVNWSPDYPTAVLMGRISLCLHQFLLSKRRHRRGSARTANALVRHRPRIGQRDQCHGDRRQCGTDHALPEGAASGGAARPNWYRKHFMNPIAGAVLDRVLSGNGVSWERLLSSMLDDLNQRHILVQLDDPVLEKLLAERGWDGAVARKAGDYLMVVDTNVGYNKTNAVVRSHLVYDVDLQNPSAPTSNLAVFQHNGAQGPSDQCDEMPAGLDQSTVEAWYTIDSCYYDYLRVYLPAGSYLRSATPHPVARTEMVMLDQDVPARVDRLDENLVGLQGFGTLLVVPMGGDLETDFQLRPACRYPSD